MHHLFMENVGPVKQCNMDIDQFTILTGPQSSGKSTIAKSIFFFRTIKDDIFDVMLKRNHSITNELSLYKNVASQVRNKFLQLFGTSRALSNKLCMKYKYNEETYINVTLRLEKGTNYIAPNYIYFEFSKNIEDFLRKYNNFNFVEEKEIIQQQLKDLFSDDYEIIFIPAGRNLISLLTTQLNYIFTIMDEDQKRSIDFCTQKYIERILKIRASFENGVQGYLDTKRDFLCENENINIINKSIELSNEVLKGKYSYVLGEERLWLNTKKYIKLNYTSSGQQESVWIFNILLYQLINKSKTFIILEEPEAHLYPDAQKSISELLSLFMHSGNSVLLTTHSPYVLGSFNIFLFAHSIACHVGMEKVSNIIDINKILTTCDAYFINKGNLKSCFDPKNNLIKNEVIDGASEVINEAFDKLLELENEE